MSRDSTGFHTAPTVALRQQGPHHITITHSREVSAGVVRQVLAAIKEATK